MISKLLTLLGAAKGATVAAVVVLSAATATVGATSPEVRDTVEQVVSAITGQTSETDEAKAEKAECDTDGKGQPAVVAQRNAADKLLRASFQTHQKALEELRGKGVDNQAAGPIVKKADDELKDVRTKALNAIGANTLGRDGQNKDTAAGTTPKPTHSPKPTCTTPVTGAVTAPAAPEVKTVETAGATPKPSQEGRVTVAEQTTLTAANKAIVDKAIKDMDAIVAKAKAAVTALPSPDHGKPADAGSNGNKPADANSNGNKPATVPGGGKPSESPKR